jgi:hypothetical protein
MPHKFNFDPHQKINVDSAPRNLVGTVAQNPKTQSALLNGINNMNSGTQLPLQLNMALGKALKKKSLAKKKREKRRKRNRELRKTNEVRNLLGFQRNYPFSNKYFGQTFPKFVPDSMYFNPIAQDIGGLPKLEIDKESNLI